MSPVVGPAYFSTMRIPLYAGREFTWNDTPSSGLKIILNQSAAHQLFPDGNTLGQSIRQDDGKRGVKLLEVVGIVGDAKYSDLRSSAPPTAYLAMWQQDGPNELSYSAVIRTRSPASTLSNSIGEITTQIAPQIPAPEVESLEEVIDDSLGAERMMTLFAVFFAICSLVVTAIGLYGTLAYATSRRTAEIGIRMALGAKRCQAASMIFSHDLSIFISGAAVGLAAALLVTRVLTTFLFHTSTRDPWVIAASIFALAVKLIGAHFIYSVNALAIMHSLRITGKL